MDGYFTTFCGNMQCYLLISFTEPNTNTKPICNVPISPSKKKRNRRHERRLLLGLGVISVRSVKEFAFKIAFKTIDTSCCTTVKRQAVIPSLAH